MRHISKVGTPDVRIVVKMLNIPNIVIVPGLNPDPTKYISAAKVPAEGVTIMGITYNLGEWVRKPLTRDEAMLEGVEINGVMCSLTAEDMWGLASVKPVVLAGQDINYHFANGAKLLLTSANLAAFEALWVPARLAFFP